MADHEYISTAEVARTLGVGVTTVKRWVDQGILTARRTAGGHRKVLLADVRRLIREEGGLEGDSPPFKLPFPSQPVTTDNPAATLKAALLAGVETQVRHLIHGAYEQGWSVEEIGDRVIGPAMTGIGEDWEKGEIDVFHEHRATYICTAILQELRPVLEAGTDGTGPVALCGNPEGDYSGLPGLLIQMVLADSGWRATNLGANTPMLSFHRALEEFQPKLLCLSLSHVRDEDEFRRDYRQLYISAERKGVAVAIGGYGLRDCLRASLPYTFHGDGLTHLAAFARTLYPRQRRPRRGRPTEQHDAI